MYVLLLLLIIEIFVFDFFGMKIKSQLLFHIWCECNKLQCMLLVYGMFIYLNAPTMESVTTGRHNYKDKNGIKIFLMIAHLPALSVRFYVDF